jgi:serine/threonine protein kinase
LDGIYIKFWFDLDSSIPAPAVLAPADVARAFGAERVRHLGTGGFGDTWLLQRGATTQVAKVLCDPDYPFDRLKREVEGLRRAEASPHVVRLEGVNRVSLSVGPRVALRFEYIQGGDVITRLRAGCWPSQAQTVQFAVGVLRGLVALHEKDAIHRDLKPENIALRTTGGWDQPVILDLGLSKFLDQPSITVYPAMLGTAPYMAPEQVAGQGARKAADLWAIGVVLYLLLTRKHPFYTADRLNQEQALERLRAGAPPLTGVDTRVGSLVKRLLSFEPYERGSATRALKELQAVVAA